MKQLMDINQRNLHLFKVEGIINLSDFFRIGITCHIDHPDILFVFMELVMHKDVVPVHREFWETFPRQSAKAKVEIIAGMNSFKPTYAQCFQCLFIIWCEDDFLGITCHTKSAIELRKEGTDFFLTITL